MYQHCPKCGFENPDPEAVKTAKTCAQCGLIYDKWLKQQFHAPAGEVDEAEVVHWVPTVSFKPYLRRAWLRVTEVFYLDRFTYYGHIAIYGILFVWGWQFILMEIPTGEIGDSFMHNINLIFHEAGHIVFAPFGWFMRVLGGSLLQLILPLMVIGVFIHQYHNNFGASVGLWWFGQSCMDLGPYIADARALQLMLLGGGTGADRPGAHDWENILATLGWLAHDQRIASMVDGFGTMMMLLAFVWGGYLLWQQRHALN